MNKVLKREPLLFLVLSITPFFRGCSLDFGGCAPVKMIGEIKVGFGLTFTVGFPLPLFVAYSHCLYNPLLYLTEGFFNILFMYISVKTFSKENMLKKYRYFLIALIVNICLFWLVFFRASFPNFMLLLPLDIFILLFGVAMTSRWPMVNDFSIRALFVIMTLLLSWLFGVVSHLSKKIEDKRKLIFMDGNQIVQCNIKPFVIL